MKADKDVIALAILAAAETAHAYSSYMPSSFTLKTFALQGTPDEVQMKLQHFRSGYIPATLWGLGLGGLVSFIAESPLPFVFAAGTAVAMVWLYEQGIPPELRLPGCNLRGLPAAQAQVTRVEVLRVEEAFGAPGV